MPKSSLTILDVGHGNSAVLIDTHGVVVIDTGSRGNLINYLEDEGITKVDVVLLSHSDADHIGGFIGLLSSNKFKLEHVRINGDAIKGSKLWDALRYELDQNQRAGKVSFEPVLVEDLSGQFDRGAVRIEILGPSRFLVLGGSGSRDSGGRKIASNSMSAVIRLSLQGRPLALLPGDLDEVGLADLVRTGANLEAPLLVYPHHGGASGCRDDATFAVRLCSLVKPKQIIFSIGRGRHGTPREEIMQAIRKWNPDVKVMCTQLSKHCSDFAPANDAPHLARIFAAGRQNRHCCAGSIQISLDGQTAAMRPTSKSHNAFVALNAKKALCQRKY